MSTNTDVTQSTTLPPFCLRAREEIRRRRKPAREMLNSLHRRLLATDTQFAVEDPAQHCKHQINIITITRHVCKSRILDRREYHDFLLVL